MLLPGLRQCCGECWSLVKVARTHVSVTYSEVLNHTAWHFLARDYTRSTLLNCSTFVSYYFN